MDPMTHGEMVPVTLEPVRGVWAALVVAGLLALAAYARPIEVVSAGDCDVVEAELPAVELTR
jgi:hypothetical protein